MIIYIAGPMSGLPDSNYPAFHAAASTLRAAGHTVLNPAENPAPPEGHPNPWQYYMRLSLKQIADAEGMVLLLGHTRSTGAQIEQTLAKGLGLPVWYQSPCYDAWEWFPSLNNNLKLIAECPAP